MGGQYKWSVIHPEYKLLCRVFGARVRVARERKHLTQADFAEMMGIRSNYYAMFERGLKGVSLHLAFKMCKLLGVTITECLPQMEVEKRKVTKVKAWVTLNGNVRKGRPSKVPHKIHERISRARAARIAA